MSAADDDDDDYLSDKFLLNQPSTSTKPTTYSQIRKEAQKKAFLKNEQNRIKGRRQREIESREEGLSKSLFERAKEEEAAGIGSGNKALSIMMKMGFKPGQSLGNAGHQTAQETPRENSPTAGGSEDNDDVDVVPKASNERVSGAQNDDTSTDDLDRSHNAVVVVATPHTTHKVEPLPLQEWAGRKGIGLGKRARSPSAAERLAKMAKMAEDMEHRDFRGRARDEYKNRQAEGRLAPAQLTCTTLDEQMGKSFNVLWLNPNNEATFPVGLIDALAAHHTAVLVRQKAESIQERLRKQMQADALQPIKADDDLLGGSSEEMKSSGFAEDQFSPELLEEATQFLRLQAQDRLHLVLSYLRDKHFYCFWCGIKFDTEEEMHNQCPGPEEDDHD
ncbi:G patch domain-containing protein 11 [Psilocybe cubensis]|uniref:DUF4187 domain-containing protein n=2 Tax=Psilocybe cubensis TaxID=181762 RepID=A0A8H7Y1I9_PSICU|nr:G patch domain-containing protein 11 [Psilocybe cubensis]KAH9482860.1 G patch domain-containing protein 11 [Psilocybe cubensis]